MGLTIEDGKGRGFTTEVTDNNKLAVAAVMRRAVTSISEENGLAFIAETNFTTTAINQVFFYLKNTDSEKMLHVNRLILNSDVNTMFHLYKATGTASGGSAVTPTNINFTSGNTADVTVLGAGSITGLTLTKLHHARILASDSFIVDWGGAIILGNGDAIAIESTTTTTFATCSVEFFLD